MNSKEKLYFLLDEYIKGSYSTETFADTFSDTFNVDTDYDLLTDKENMYFQKLCDVTDRFTVNEKDLQQYDCYYNEEQVKQKVLEVQKLLLNK